MKLTCKVVFLAVLALSAGIITGCASGPKLGQPTPLQAALNALPAVPVAGNDLKFDFGGSAWIAKVAGKHYMAGTFESADAAGGSSLTLKQTHLYSDKQKPGIGGDVGWVKTPGPKIELEYKKGPPESLTLK